MKNMNLVELVKQAEKRYMKRMTKYDWFVAAERPFKPALKPFPKLGVFKASNVSFDPATLEAVSYNWWKFVSKIKGKVVVNTYGYSPSTRKHQYKVANLMSDLGIDTDIKFEAPKGLQDLTSAVAHYETKISDLMVAMNKPGTRAEKNKERAKDIKSHLATIVLIKKLMK